MDFFKKLKKNIFKEASSTSSAACSENNNTSDDDDDDELRFTVRPDDDMKALRQKMDELLAQRKMSMNGHASSFVLMRFFARCAKEKEHQLRRAFWDYLKAEESILKDFERACDEQWELLQMEIKEEAKRAHERQRVKVKEKEKAHNDLEEIELEI